MTLVPTLIGVGGPFEGEAVPLEPFRPYIVGRSRSADISVRRSEKYRLQSDAERDADTAAKTISARHFQITFYNMRSIEVKNLSVNGTRLDDKPIGDAVIITDIGKRPHVITFGMDGKFKLQMRPATNAAPVPAASATKIG